MGYQKQNFEDGQVLNAEHLNNIEQGIEDAHKELEGKQPAGNYAFKSEIPEVPVKSVNGQTGAVTLSAQDVGADPSGSAESKVNTHNTNTDSHNDIRLLIEGLNTRLNALANSDDTTLDQMAEVVTYIKSNRTLIESITTGKVNVTDIINNLTTNVANKPLSASQGVVLKGLIDTLQNSVDGMATKQEVEQLSKEIVNEVEARKQAITELKAQGVQQVPLYANSVEELEQSGDITKVYMLPDGGIYGYAKGNAQSEEATFGTTDWSGMSIISTNNQRYSFNHIGSTLEGKLKSITAKLSTAMAGGSFTFAIAHMNGGAISSIEQIVASIPSGSGEAVTLVNGVDFTYNGTIKVGDLIGFNNGVSTKIYYGTSANEWCYNTTSLTDHTLTQKTYGFAISAVVEAEGLAEYAWRKIGNAFVADLVVGAPEFVDSVDEMTDTRKVYILKSTGTIWAYKSVESGTTIETVTEQIVGTTDNPWGAGRLSSGNPNGLAGYVTTPYIDLSKYDVPFELHLEGIPWVYTSDGNRRYAQYDESKAHLRTDTTSANSFIQYWSGATLTANSDDTCVIAFTPPITDKSKNVGFIRVSGQGTEADANVYITYEAEVAGQVTQAWVDTGAVYGSSETVANITEFNLSNPSVKAFIETADYSDSDYSTTNVTNHSASSYYRKDLPMPIIIDWLKDSSVTEYVVTIDSQTYYTKDSELVLYNLIPNKTYYYTVYGLCANSTTKLVKSGNFKTSADKTRMINIDGIQNVRDIGGYTGYGSKKVKYDLIYRGSAFDETIKDNLRITDKGKQEMLVRVGIGTDLDLRGANNVSASALGSDVAFYTPQYSYLTYANAITDATSKGYFKDMLEYIVTQLTANKPIYIHCSGGCDRTGTLVFLLLGLLGVSESDLAKEYELSSFATIGKFRTRNSTVYDYSGMVTAIKTYSGSTITDKFYNFAIACGVSADTITKFRNLMLQ